MQFTEIYTAVQDEFKRPDKQTLVERRIKEAILAAHKLDRFAKDTASLTTGSIVCAGPVSSYDINTSEIVRYRDICSVQLWNETTGQATTALKIYSFPGTSVDFDGDYTEKGVWQLGNLLQIRLHDTLGTNRKFYLTYLKYPDITTNPIPESWVMREFHGYIIEATLASLFRTTGNAERAGAANAEAVRLSRELIHNSLLVGG